MLTTEYLDRYSLPAPVFATVPHASRSERYAHIPTIRIVDHMKELGFGVVQAQAAKTKMPREGAISKAGFQPHILRFRHEDAKPVLDGTVFDILLRNAHDGTKAIDLFGGAFRFVCANGLVTYSQDCGKASIGHRGGNENLWDRIVESVKQVQASTSVAERSIDGWTRKHLSFQQQIDFATAALQLRYPDNNAPITPWQLLNVRREQDDHGDAWSTFNRVQENITQGGYKGTATGKMRTIRRIRGADADLRLNAGLWGLAEKAFA
jgi:hypothetical protein